MRQLIGGFPALRAQFNITCNQVVHIGTALRPIPYGQGRQQDIVLNKKGAMIHFHKNIIGAVIV